MQYKMENGTVAVLLVIFFVGLIMSIFFVFRKDDSESSTYSQGERSTAVSRSGSLEKTEPLRDLLIKSKVESLQQRVSELEVESREKNDAGSREKDPKHAPTTENPKPRKITSEEFQSILSSNYEIQQYDPKWAPSAANTIESELLELAGDIGFAVEKVECKDDGCRAILEFDDFSMAQERMTQLGGRPYRINCSMGFATPPPKDEKQPYQVKVFFEKCNKNDTFS